ncbi:hypothetical protein PG987_006126 [Apiospora arundinis]
MPDDEEMTERLTDGSGDTHSSSRSRRAGLVTSNACTECRKKRAKCDGNNPCARCNKHGIAHCAYETPSRQSTDSLRQEIDELRRQLDQKNTVLSALVNPQSPEEVLTRSRGGESVDIVSNVLEGTLHSEEDAAVPAVDSGPSLNLSQPTVPLLEQGLGGMSMAADIEQHDQVEAVHFRGLTRSADTGFAPEVLMWTASMVSYFRVSPRLFSDQVLSGMANYGFMGQMSIPTSLIWQCIAVHGPA